MKKDFSKKLSFVCESFSNSKNWGHKATAYYNGVEVGTTKCIYQNRTWEVYQYQTVMMSLVHVLDKSKTVPCIERLLAYNTLK